MNNKAKETVVTAEGQSSIRIFGRIVAEDMSQAELGLVSGGNTPVKGPTGTVNTDTKLECDW